MNVSVLIPFASDDPWRREALDHVVGSYQYETVVGTTTGPWCKARAVADAVRQASGDVFVVADADCLCDVADAVQAVVDGASWAIPHLHVHRLDQEATRQVYDGVPPEETTGRADMVRRGLEGGGIVVLTREVWERAPLDSRFTGWGQEDAAWARALSCLAGPPVRFRHDLWHLWHPVAERQNRSVGTVEGLRLYMRYGKAASNPVRMAALVDEGRTVDV